MSDFNLVEWAIQPEHPYEDEVAEIEEKSLRQFASDSGVEVREVEAMLLESTAEDVSTLRSSLQLTKSQRSWATHLDNLVDTGDALAIGRILARIRKGTVLGRIASALQTSRLPLVTPEPFKALAEQLGADQFDARRIDHCMGLLYEIPVVGLYGSRFLAYIQGESPISEMPAVVYYRNLDTSLWFLLELLSPPLQYSRENLERYQRENPNYLSDSGEPDPFAVIDQLVRGTRDASFVGALEGIMECVFGEAPWVRIEQDFLARNARPDIYKDVIFAHNTAIEFLLIHEYAHFVHGHLESSHSPEHEFLADRWATWVIELSEGVDENRIERDGVWPVFGIVAALALFMYREGFNETFAEQTHPLSTVRFTYLVSNIEDEGSRAIWNMLWITIARIVVPTLSVRWPEQFGPGWTKEYGPAMVGWADKLAGGP